MKINDLLEARRNKNHPAQQVDRIPGKGQKSLYELLKPYMSQDDVYISFTELPKLGVNPKSIHNTTPNGIYAYPLKSMSHEIGAIGKEAFPLGADRPWVNIFRVKRPLQNVETYSKEQFKKDTENLVMPESPSNSFLSKIMLYNKQFKQLMSMTFEYSRFKHNKWAKVLYDMGYAGFVDYGKGWIYPDEPTQAVIFSMNDIELLERINLKTDDMNYKTYDEKQKNPDRFITNLMKQFEKVKNDEEKLFKFCLDNNIRIGVFGDKVPQNTLIRLVKHYINDVNVIPGGPLRFLNAKSINQLIDDKSINWKKVSNNKQLLNYIVDDPSFDSIYDKYTKILGWDKNENK